jgi:hypothetical protein
MPKFYNANDLNFIKSIAEEVVDYVVEQAITLFKVSVGETKTNLYGESLGKVWHAPANLMAIIDREPPNVSYDGEVGADRTQSVEFRFNIMRLRTETIPRLRDINGTLIPVGAIQNSQYGYPEIGDIILFDETYYEIDNIRRNALIGGQPKMYNKSTNEFEDARMFLIATSHMVRRSQVQIEDRIY